MQKTITLISILAAILSFALICGCEKGPTTISYGETAIFAELIRSEHGDGIIQNLINVSVGGTRLVPIASINNDTLELYSYRRDENAYFISRFRENVSVNPGDECQLIVYHNEGKASATIALPGDFEITSPGENDTLNPNEDLSVSWSTSEGAERYKLTINLYYHYTDTSGASNSYRFDTTFYTTSSCTIPKERIFPPEVGSVVYGSGNISIYSESGPRIGHTTEGNIYGEGVGYFIAYNLIPELRYFGIGNGLMVYGPIDFPPIDIGLSPTRQFEKHLEYLKIHDPDFMWFE
jgi:hypothetical protein